MFDIHILVFETDPLRLNNEVVDFEVKKSWNRSTSVLDSGCIRICMCMVEFKPVTKKAEEKISMCTAIAINNPRSVENDLKPRSNEHIIHADLFQNT